MTSASTEASSFASRGRSCRSSSPTRWWVLKVTSRTGMGGWSGPGAGRMPEGPVMGASLSGARQRHVEHLLELRGALLAHREQEPRLPAVEHQLADLVAEVRAGAL